MTVDRLRGRRRGASTTELAESPDAAEAAQSPGESVWRSRLPLWARAGGAVWVWLGLAISVVGFGLIAVAWGQVAGETQVYRQLPYVVSAGFVGLCLVVVGVGVINIASRHHDGILRDRQIQQLAGIMQELKQEFTKARKSQQ